jgi:hypothetical protein
MAIVAPSFVPKYNPSAYMWKGISDIFGDITQMREDKLQRQRQEAADARAVTSAQSLERNRKQIYDLKAAKAKRLAKIEADFAAYTGSEQQQLDKLAVEGFTPRTGKYLGFRGAGPSASINTMTTPTLRDRSDAELRFATQSRQEHLQNLGYIETRLKTIESRAQAAIASGDANLLAELKQEGQRLLNEQRTAKNALAEATKEFNIATAKNQASTSAALAKTRVVQSDQTTTLNDALNVLRGETRKSEVIRENVPYYREQDTFGDELSGDEITKLRTVQRKFQKGDPTYDQAVLDYQLFGSPKADQLKALGVADAVAGKAIPDTMTKTQRQKSLAATMLEEIKARPDYHEKAFDEEEINRARDNILQAARQIAIASGDPSLDNQWKIAHILSKTFNSGFVKGEMLDKDLWFTGDYQDYTPMSTDDMVTSYVPPEVTARYNQLKDAGKNDTEIERILRSEGLIK